jgi:hypothetical protein
VKLWAVTSYFNPARYRRRLDNFRTLRARLRAPLIVVELAVDAPFDLADSDAELVVHLRDGDIMWQKERLLNVAISRLPSECSAVAWLDGDVILEREDWVEGALRALDRAPLVQLFRDRFDLGRDVLPENAGDPAAFARGQSLAFRLQEGVPPDIVSAAGTVQHWQASLGLAWAARRDLVARHGLYDAGILGGGDRAFAAAALGQMSAVAGPWYANAAQVDHYRRWAEPFHAEVRGRIGHLDGRLFHLWHGDRVHRRYLSRYRDLQPFGFDPARDIRRSPEGAWRWSSDKAAMHAYVRDYFHSRREDG